MMSHPPYEASHFQYLFFFTESLQQQATGLMTTPCLQRSDGPASSCKPLEMKIKDFFIQQVLTLITILQE